MLTYVCLGANDPESTRPSHDAVLRAFGLRRVDTSIDQDEAGWYGWDAY